MTDVFTDMVAKKHTNLQKRGLKAGSANTKEFGNDRRVLPLVRPSGEDTRAAARLSLASLAMGHPDLCSDHSREEWLRDVLLTLGLMEEKE